MSESIDFLIVGGGLAGHNLQFQLQERGQKTLVIDASKENYSSVIAAGLVNPIAGKFFTLTWRANEIFNGLSAYYKELEVRFNTSFFTPKILTRVFATAGEQNIWLSKAHQAKYKGYCSFINDDLAGLKTQYGLLNINKGGRLEITAFLNACKQNMPHRDELFEYEYLNLDANSYKDITFKNIVFCEGYKVLENSLFSNLPFVATKGELIEIEADLPYKDRIFLGPVFMQHMHNNLWRIGATYNPNDTSLNPTDEKKSDLIEKLDKVINVPYKVLKHYAGVRPATVDRRPIMGVHSKFNNVYVFNGFGSKGVSLIPLHAMEFSDYLLNNTPLHSEVRLDRFK